MSRSERAPSGAATGARRQATAVALAAWLMCVASGVVTSGEPGPGRIPSDARAQAAIEETVSAIVRNDEAAADRFASLQRLGEKDRGALLLQMALYLEAADGTERSMAGSLVLDRLGFTPREIIDAVLPRLDDAGPALRRTFAGLLAAVDRHDGGAADFGVYEAWLAARGDRPPAAFVAYLYDVAPGEAVRCLQGVYGRGVTLEAGSVRALDTLKGIAAGRDASRALTQDERARAASALTTLTADPAWWVRRYAAVTLRDDATLALPAVAERLRKDPDPLVREGLARPPGAGGAK